MLKKFRFFTIIIVLILLFLPGFAKLQELKQKLSDIEDEIQKTQREVVLFEKKIAQMKNQEYLEIVAREKMGIVKKGETVIKIIQEGEEANATSANVSRP